MVSAAAINWHIFIGVASLSLHTRDSFVTRVVCRKCLTCIDVAWHILIIDVYCIQVIIYKFLVLVCALLQYPPDTALCYNHNSLIYFAYFFIMYESYNFLTSDCSAKHVVVAGLVGIFRSVFFLYALRWDFGFFCPVLKARWLLLLVNPLVLGILVGPGFFSDPRGIWLERRGITIY